MKLSFSTLGCPGWSFDEIYSAAADLGIQGIEIRGIGDKVYAPDCPVFSHDRIDATREKLKRSNLQIPALDSAAVLAVPEKSEKAMNEAYAYIDLAQKLSASFVRVMPTRAAEPLAADIDLCKKQYTELCVYAQQKGVVPIMETNGVFCNSHLLADFLDSIPCENKGALWDVHHPFRYNGEAPEKTAKTLGKRILHTHVKDSVMIDGAVAYRMMGYGDVPLTDAINALKTIGYDGYISLEWLKRWNPELQEPGIVFAHFVSFMDYMLSN